MNTPKLIVIATPIGNIEEITIKAINNFKEYNNFFCEDTRVFKKLLNLLNISLKNKNFYSLNSFNEKKVVNNFNFKNEVYCLVSDAGYPLISDPGFFLINHFIKNNFDLEIVNGPCSVIHSLVASGFNNNEFFFKGFLSNSKNQRIQELSFLKNEIKSVLIIFESVHRIIDCLKDIKKIFGDDVKICVCKELTKINEKIYRDNINSILENLVEKGEFIIVINNHSETKSFEQNFEKYYFELKKLIDKKEKDKVACKIIAYKYGLKSKDLYAFWQSKKNNI